MALMAAIAVTVVAHAQINAEQVLRIGRNALYFEDYVLSIQYFNQVVAAKPYLAEPYFYRAVAKISLDDYQGAEEDATLCINRNPFILDAYQVRGAARQNQRKFALAVSDYDKGLEQFPDNKMFLTNRAICLLELKQYDAADSSFHRVIQLDPKNERAYLGLAQMSLARNDTAMALEYINKSLAVARNNEMAWAARADIHSRHKETYPDAVADLDTLITLQPKVAANFINRAFLKYALDDYFGAMSDYDYAIGLEPDNQLAIYDRAQLSAEVGEDSKAIADFSRVLELDPGNFLALYNRAQLYMRTRQYKRAVSDYDRILRKYPRFESGYMARAEAKRLSGDARGCERDNQTAIAIFKQKGIHYSIYNPATAEVKMAEKKIRQEQEQARQRIGQPETEEDIMKKFNQLLTVKNDNTIKPEYDNRTRGHIQNSNYEIDPMPMFMLTYYSDVNKLNGKTNYMRELTEVNDSRLLPRMLSLSTGDQHLDSAAISDRFASIEYYDGLLSTSKPRSADYFARAIDQMMVKNPEAALADVDRALALSPKFTLAYFLRADAHYLQHLMARKGQAKDLSPTADTKAEAMLHSREMNTHLTEMIADLNHVIDLSPRNVYAFFNMGNAYLLTNNYTEAISCYTKAIEFKPDLGEAYYNRGLLYLKLGNRQNGMSDLSKAGELGIVPSYHVLKRMND